MMNMWLQYLKNKYLRFNQIKVSETSRFICDGHLNQVRVIINDRHNNVTIGQNTQVTKIDIVVSGEGNQVILGKDCRIECDVPPTAYLGD